VRTPADLADPPELPELTAEERSRYGRHLILPEVGLDGQRRLKGARVLLVGAGGLGSPAALYLAAAGVGHLTIVDPDVVDASNLQRQVLHGTAALGRPKVDSGRERLADLNPHVRVEGVRARLDRSNALELTRAHDLTVDGTDNFATRYLVNDACVLAGKPNVHASIFRFEGQASTFATEGGPCYRCLYPEPPPAGAVPSCAEAGVLGVLPGLLGVIQAAEAVKLLLGVGEPLVGRLLLVDALGMSFRTLRFARDPACPACGARRFTELPEPFEEGCATAGSTGAAVPAEVRELTPRELAARLRGGPPLELIDVREPQEWAIARIEGARLLPLSGFEAAPAALPRDRDLVLYCHAGVRSVTAARRLQAAGFTRVWSLAGGIARWSAEVDPSVPSY